MNLACAAVCSGANELRKRKNLAALPDESWIVAQSRTLHLRIMADVGYMCPLIRDDIVALYIHSAESCVTRAGLFKTRYIIELGARV